MPTRSRTPIASAHAVFDPLDLDFGEVRVLSLGLGQGSRVCCASARARSGVDAARLDVGAAGSVIAIVGERRALDTDRVVERVHRRPWLCPSDRLRLI